MSQNAVLRHEGCAERIRVFVEEAVMADTQTDHDVQIGFFFVQILRLQDRIADVRAEIFLLRVDTDIRLSDCASFAGNAADFSFQPWIASLQYNEELWSLTAEFALRKQSLEGDNLSRNFDITGHSWYLQYQRRMTPSWSWLVRYDSLVNNTADRSGRAYEQSGFGPAHSQFADDVTLGLQWTPNSRLMLAGEYHHVNGTGWLPTQDNPDASATRQHWNMLLFQLSLRF